MQLTNITKNYRKKYGFQSQSENLTDLGLGISEAIVRKISKLKHEDNWMLEKRLQAWQAFRKIKLPSWGADLSGIDFQKIHYYVTASATPAHSWAEVPEKIKATFSRLGIPEAEKKFLAGVATQYESEVIYHNLQQKWRKLGIEFYDTDTAYKKFPELFQRYFGKVVPAKDNKFAALNTAVWSGGSFIYVPPGVKVSIPLQAYFRINSPQMGQFERTLIIADECSEVHYIEGCTAPMYSSNSLHSAVVEIIVRPKAKVRYTTVQNWSTNVYNLVTKRAFVYQDAIMEWVDCNLGSKVTMKYPAIYLLEEGAHGEVLAMAYAGKGQHQDSGAKIIHRAAHTSSMVQSKSISCAGGRTSYRGLIQVSKGAQDCKISVKCDALILDAQSQTDTYPVNKIRETKISLAHEASVSKISETQLAYLLSRGLSESEANALLISGFIENISRELPMEYALELNTLLKLNMEGSVG